MGKESLALRLEGKMGAGQSRKGGSQTQVKLKHFWGGKLGTVWDGRRTEEQVWGDLRSKGEDMMAIATCCFRTQHSSTESLWLKTINTRSKVPRSPGQDFTGSPGAPAQEAARYL